MNVTLIAAMAKNRVIGKDNQLIWHFPEDLKHFKKLTSGHHIIMGRRTFESVGKALPNRVNIIVTRQKDYRAPNCLVVHDLPAALRKAEGDPQPFIAGGAEIYTQALAYAKTIELTLIHGEYEGDRYFPEFDLKLWKLARGEKREADDRHEHPYEFLTYKKNASPSAE